MSTPDRAWKVSGTAAIPDAVVADILRLKREYGPEYDAVITFAEDPPRLILVTRLAEDEEAPQLSSDPTS